MLLIWEDIWDRIIDYSVGSVLILCFLVSSVLNPTLLYHYYLSGRKGVTTFLFKCLIVSDFLTNLVTPLVFTAFMMTPTPHRAYENLLMVISGCFSFTMGSISQCSTTLLAITRFLKIRYPFKKLEKRTTKLYLAIYTFIVIIAGITLVILSQIELSHPEKEGETAVTSLIILVVMTFLIVLHCFVGIIFSMITVGYLYLTRDSTSQYIPTKRVCETILLMNIVYILTFVGYAVPETSIIGNILVDNLMPILTAAVNPIILFARAQAIRQTLVLLMRSVSPRAVISRDQPADIVTDLDVSYRHNSVQIHDKK